VWAIIKKQRQDVILLVLSGIFLAIFARSGSSAMPGRILPVLPFLALLGARFIDDTLMAQRATGILYVCAVLIAGAIFIFPYFNLMHHRDIRDIASEWIASSIPARSTIGILNEPSPNASPGIIDLKYRHPDHKELPDYPIVILGQKEPLQHASAEPDYIILSDADTASPAGYLGNYHLISEFSAGFSFNNLRISNRIPTLLFTPNYIRVYRRSI
jgi:hypothetical protein